MTAKTEKAMAKQLAARNALEKKTARVRAFVILDKDGSTIPAGRGAICYPKDGAGRLQAYVFFLGSWRSGWASGYGYDKASAAMEEAIPELYAEKPWGGENWDSRMRDMGYRVLFAT